MEAYELLETLVKRYPNNYELGAAFRNLYREIDDVIKGQNDPKRFGNLLPPSKEIAIKRAVMEILKKNFQPN